MAFEFQKITVLIVDDTRPMKLLLGSILNALKVKECYTAQDGPQGLEVFKSCNPDIVITDFVMPGFNGAELTKAIREENRKSNILTPVILMSGHSDLKLIQESREAGVTEFLSKPFSLNNLSRRISYVFSNPRDCVNTTDYYGPDRRRQNSPSYSGTLRRKGDENGE